MPRMKILSTIEQEAFDSPPVFNSSQRKQHFDFPLAIQQLAAGLRTPVNQLYFLVSCGYFKATKQFFSVRTFRPKDIEYVAARAGLTLAAIDLSAYDKQSLARHQQLILRFYGFRAFTAKARQFLVEEITCMVRAQLRPKLILWRSVDVLVREKIEVPHYFRLAELILTAINGHHQALAALVERTLSNDTRALLDALLVQEAADTPAPGKTSAYQLTLLKKLSQSTKPSKVKARVVDLHLIDGLYRQLQPVLAALALNPAGIRYYANSVIKAEIFQVARRNDEDRYLHLIAFITHQYYRLQDNLIDGLLTNLQSFQNSAHRDHRDQCYAHREQRNQSLRALVGYLDEELLQTLTVIRAIAADGQFSDTEKVERIRALLEAQEASRRHAELKLTALKQALESELVLQL